MSKASQLTHSIKVRLRPALESFNIDEVVSLGEELKKAEIQEGTWGAVGDIPAIRIARMIATSSNLEIEELAASLLPDRLSEIQNVPLFFEGMGINYSETVLAAVIDRSTSDLSAWPRFAMENPRPTYMWGKSLTGGLPAQPGLVPEGLSYNARLALTATKAVTRYLPTTAKKIAYAIAVQENEATQILEELRGAGAARESTTGDLLSILTVPQLEPLLDGIDIPKSANKTTKIEKILSATNVETILDAISRIDHSYLENNWTIGLNALKTSEFHRQWAELIGHYLVFSVSRDGDWEERISNEYIDSSWKIELSCEAPGMCPYCESMNGKKIDSKEQAPPFHLGCRCTTTDAPPSSSYFI